MSLGFKTTTRFPHGILIGRSTSGDLITISTANSRSKYTFTNPTLCVEGTDFMQYNATENSLVIASGASGSYLLIGNAVVSGDRYMGKVELSVCRNGAVDVLASKLNDQSQADLLTINTIVSLKAGDSIAVYFTTDGDADELSILSVTLTLIKC